MGKGMKSTKFVLNFRDYNFKTEIKVKAAQAGTSMNQYILDCLKPERCSTCNCVLDLSGRSLFVMTGDGTMCAKCFAATEKDSQPVFQPDGAVATPGKCECGFDLIAGQKECMRQRCSKYPSDILNNREPVKKKKPKKEKKPSYIRGNPNVAAFEMKEKKVYGITKAQQVGKRKK